MYVISPTVLLTLLCILPTCVEHFDHRCPWVGQCIGKGNYRFFFMFVSSTIIVCLYVFAFCYVSNKKIMDEYRCNPWRAFLKIPVSMILILYTFLTVWFVGGLTVSHLYLIFTNQNNFRSMVKLDSSAHFATSMSLGLTLSPEMPKSSFDIEMGKRQAVRAENLKEMHSQIDSVGESERFRTQPMHTNHDDKANWEMSPDRHVLAAEFGMEHGPMIERKFI